MKRANVKRHETFETAQTRLRLLISTLEDSAPAAEDDDDLESLDFTNTEPEPDTGEEVSEAETTAQNTPEDR
jgi:hypothetical protein